MNSVNLGRVSFVPQGTWSESATYKKLDCVEYSHATYYAKKDVPAGTAPTDTEYWSPVIDTKGVLGLSVVDGAICQDGESDGSEATKMLMTDETGKQLVQAIKAKDEKIEKLEQRIAALKDDMVASYCPPFEASGNPVACYPAKDSNLDVVASWKPTQDGEGTPYPAGGGKNLFRLYDADTTVSANGLTAKFDLKTETLTMTGTSTKTDEPWLLINQKEGLQLPDFAIGETYTLSWTKIAGMYVQIVYTNSSGKLQALCCLDTASVTFTVPSTYVKFFGFQVGVSATAGAVNGTTRIQIEKGSTATAYAPYANIRPIHGKSSVKVERCGENLLNLSADNVEDGIYDNGIKADGTLGQQRIKNPVSVTPGTKITYTTDMKLKYNLRATFFSRNGAYISNVGLTPNSTFTVPDNANYLYVHSNGYGLIGAYAPWFMLTVGATAPAEYAPYVGEAKTLALPEEIYGADLQSDGEGHETWKLLTLTGEEQWNYESNAYFVGHYILNNLPTVTDGKCSHFIYHYNYGGDCIFCVGDSVYTGPQLTAKHTGVDAWKAYLAAQYAAGTPVQIAYKLATPVPFAATGGSAVKALSGTNTVLTDAGAVTVKGRADLVHVITKLQDATSILPTTD